MKIIKLPYLDKNTGTCHYCGKEMVFNQGKWYPKRFIGYCTYFFCNQKCAEGGEKKLTFNRNKKYREKHGL